MFSLSWKFAQQFHTRCCRIRVMVRVCVPLRVAFFSGFVVWDEQRTTPLCRTSLKQACARMVRVRLNERLALSNVDFLVGKSSRGLRVSLQAFEWQQRNGWAILFDVFA